MYGEVKFQDITVDRDHSRIKSFRFSPITEQKYNYLFAILNQTTLIKTDCQSDVLRFALELLFNVITTHIDQRIDMMPAEKILVDVTPLLNIDYDSPEIEEVLNPTPKKNAFDKKVDRVFALAQKHGVSYSRDRIEAWCDKKRNLVHHTEPIHILNGMRGALYPQGKRKVLSNPNV